MNPALVIDGSQGEGGGQILRSAVSFATLCQRPIVIENIRADRRNPGLAAQHITSVRAAAAICGARVDGDTLGSSSLSFVPQSAIRPGTYEFDVAAAREGGSAGATSLVMQTVLPPLALAAGTSRVTIRGGTHMAWSPSFDYLRDVWLAALARLGVDASLTLRDWGWFPVGGGCIEATIRGRPARRFDRCRLTERGDLVEVTGRAVAANLPAHIPQRMCDRATALLAALQCRTAIEPVRVRAACAGAGLFLTARYMNIACGFGALGARGKASEQVAEEAVESLLRHLGSGAALDKHLGDQLLGPLAFADGPSRFTVEAVTRHLETNAWVLGQFGLAGVNVARREDGTGEVEVSPNRQVAAPAIDAI